MKKIFSVVGFIGCVFFAQPASSQDLIGSSYGKTVDSVATGATVYLTTPFLNMPAGKKGYTIQFDATNISGTSTITAILQSSNDNVTWSNHFRTPGQTGVNCDTLAISGTVQHIWNILPGAAANYGNAAVTYYSNSGQRQYFRVKLIAGATQLTRVKARNTFQ